MVSTGSLPVYGLSAPIQSPYKEVPIEVRIAKPHLHQIRRPPSDHAKLTLLPNVSDRDHTKLTLLPNASKPGSCAILVVTNYVRLRPATPAASG